MFQIGARADVHVQAGDRKPIAAGPVETLGDLPVPNAVFRLLAAGVGLLAMAVAEAGIDPQGDASAGGAAAELVDHVGRAAVDVDAAFDAQIERLGVENVGRVDDRRRIAGGREAGGQGTADFAGADRVDQRARAADQIEDRQVGAGLFGVADHVEGRQVGDPPADHGRVVDERRRAELPGQLRDGDAGDFSAEIGHSGQG